MKIRIYTNSSEIKRFKVVVIYKTKGDDGGIKFRSELDPSRLWLIPWTH